MSKLVTTLNLLNVGQCCSVIDISDKCKIKRRLRDLGIANGSQIKSALKGPSKNLTAYEICGALVALRNEDCSYVYVEVEE